MEDVVVKQVYSAADHVGFFSMFCDATLVVKAVIIILILLSIYSWSVMIQKFFLLRLHDTHSAAFYRLFWKAETVGKIYKGVRTKKDLYSRLFVQSFEEYQTACSLKENGIAGMAAEIRETIDRLIRLESYKIFDQLEDGMDFLASIGSSTPFIGLLGTVWGIMDSFEQIGVTKNANLAVVAPGISEALFTTALGLIVTIPAVIGYNKINGKIRKYMDQLDNYSDQLKDLFTKDGAIDEKF